MRKLLVAMVLGAALAYFFDPVSGDRRRRCYQRRRDATPVAGGNG